MSDRGHDFELLQRFARHSEQSAFADLVRRHLDLVFATALRRVEDTGAAQEVAQNVFAALARKAWQFAPDDSLPAWLHKAALLESKSWLRGELGRRRRELTAAELSTTMHTPEDQPAIQALLPLLDEALLSLREKDRTALLLRFFEGHSLRQVGAALGVSEDTAQKRVQTALEKVSAFFKRRGFKTASVAAAAAGLQHSATSASAGMVGAVVRAALQAAPPALSGVGALLARLASLTQVQTGALCVALVALSIGWQLRGQRGAAEEAKRIQAQLLDAQNQYAAARSEVDRLTADSQRLEQALVRANETAIRAAESAKAFDVWKKRMRAQLLGDDYRWDDDSPFARIPKSSLPEFVKLGSSEPFSTTGTVQPYARELLGLTPGEREAVEETLHRHFTDVNARRAAGVIETNKPLVGREVAGKVFVVPDSGADAKERDEQTLTELRGILGEERWLQVQARREPTYYVGGGILAILRNNELNELSLWVETDDRGTPFVGYKIQGGMATVGMKPLSMFLPEGDPNRTDGAEEFAMSNMSEAVRPRGMGWLQEQAIARLGKRDKP